MKAASEQPILRPETWRIGSGLMRLCGGDLAAERNLLVWSAVAVLLTVVFRLLEPWPLKFIYDAIFRHGHGRAKEVYLLGISITAWEAGHRMALIVLAAGSMVLFSALGGLFDYLSSVALGIAASKVLTRLRLRLFRHLESLDMSFHRRHKTGDLIASVTADIDRLRDVTVSALLPFLTRSLVLLAMVAVMLGMNWRLGVLVLPVFPAFYIVVTRTTKRIQRVAREQRKRDGGIASIAAEAMGAIQTIQAYGLEEEFVHRISGDNQGSLKEGNRAQQLSSRLAGVVDLFAALATAGVLLLGAKNVLEGKLTAGDLIVFISYLRNSFKPIRQTAKYLARIAKALASGGRVLALFGETPAIVNTIGSITAPRLRGEIRFEGVSFAYRPGHPVLKDVSFTLRAGERGVIVGSSGSGKSTLAALLMRIHDPQVGVICVDGEDIRNFTIESLRAQIAVVMQETVLFTGSIAENIRLGSLRASEEQIRRAAAKARAAEFIDQMSSNYATRVGERGATLSGGQRQRMAIARAYLRDSSILLLDEATTGLDSENRGLVLSALRELSESRTTLTITHEISEAQDADRILYLCDGRLEEQGTHEQLMRRDGGYRAMYMQRAPMDMQQEAVHAG